MSKSAFLEPRCEQGANTSKEIYSLLRQPHLGGWTIERNAIALQSFESDSNLVAAYASIVDSIDLAQQSNRGTECIALAVS